MADLICTNCGSVNDYVVNKTDLHHTAYCNGCGRYIKHLPKENKDLVIYFGKFKGTCLKDFKSKDHVSWLNWALNNTTNFKPHEIETITKHLSGV